MLPRRCTGPKASAQAGSERSVCKLRALIHADISGWLFILLLLEVSEWMGQISVNLEAGRLQSP